MSLVEEIELIVSKLNVTKAYIEQVTPKDKINECYVFVDINAQIQASERILNFIKENFSERN